MKVGGHRPKGRIGVLDRDVCDIGLEEPDDPAAFDQSTTIPGEVHVRQCAPPGERAHQVGQGGEVTSEI